MNFDVGDIAKSLAGNDKNRIYLIIDKDNTHVWLSDGKYKPLSKTKKKNIKHIQVIHSCDNILKEKLKNRVTNEEIKYFLKTFGGYDV